MFVGKPVILLGSITYAMKSRDILFRYGIKSYVERTPRTQDRLGCGYGIFVPDRTDQAEDILRNSGVRVLGRSERAGGV
ncbi:MULTISPECIES: DUF3343 domain-containing protein [Clostridium]|uniref:DUF3343 domain-containing protein n=1 Tax=Clostridium TaxID=1485 RepID=UPI000A267B07|nr:MULTISPECIES: DUF3343 domain-containing protein [Clostridium]MDU7339270.1 DUF3343 domain-containing protein [Clostridium sp.]